MQAMQERHTGVKTERPPTEKELEKATQSAIRKRDWIIEKYGDEGGIRRQPWYLHQLIKEAIEEERFADYTMTRCREIQAGKLTEKKGRLKNRRPNPNNIISTTNQTVNSREIKKEEDR